MPAEENRNLLKPYIGEFWRKQNPAAVDNFLSSNYKRHRSPTAAPLTREGQKQLFRQFRTEFPDIQPTLEEVIADDIRLAFRSTIRATHKGEFFCMAPTGRQIIAGLVECYSC